MGAGSRGKRERELEIRETVVAGGGVAFVFVPVVGFAQPGECISERIFDVVAAGRGDKEGARAVAVVVARIALVIAIPGRDFAREIRYSARFGRRGRMSIARGGWRRARR